jgi:hypothetical protein
VSLQVVAGIRNITAVATVASLNAVDQLLSREVLKSAKKHDASVGAHGGLSGESPAGAALSLVEDGPHAVVTVRVGLGSPVDRRVAKDRRLFSNVLGHGLLSLEREDGLVFFVGPVAHMVVTDSVGVALFLAMLLNEGVLDGEVAQSLLVLLNRFVGLSELRDVAEEARFNLRKSKG